MSAADALVLFDPGRIADAHRAQLALYTARIVLLRVESEQLSQRVNLHLALGGSFEPAPSGATETR
jgi:outer membrane protein TolC